MQAPHTPAGVRQRRVVSPTRSYLSQIELPATFGLGEHPGPVELRVVWPDGEVRELGPVEVDRLVEVVRDAD